MTDFYRQIAATHARPFDLSVFGQVVERRVLYEDVLPIVWSGKTDTGLNLLCYLADESEDEAKPWFTLVISPAAGSVIEDLVAGCIGVREALTSSIIVVARTEDLQLWSDAYLVLEEEIPHEYLPEPETLLYASMTPILSIRATGATIQRGSLPASVIHDVAARARKAIKPLLDCTLQLDPSGRRQESIRSLYDLPAKRLKAASFEIQFGPPASLEGDDANPQLREALAQAFRLFNSALAWADTNDDSCLDGLSKVERSAVFKALRDLAPPQSGHIERMDVTGHWVEKRVRLTRDVRQRARDRLSLLTTTQPIIDRSEGLIVEFDRRDDGSFTLRSADGDLPCVFDEEHLTDEMYEAALFAFQTQLEVTLLGLREVTPSRLVVRVVLFGRHQESVIEP